MVSEVDMGNWLDLPQSKVDEINSNRNYLRPSRRREAYFDLYATDHPCPSWKQIAKSLRSIGLSFEADVVESTYLQGIEVLSVMVYHNTTQSLLFQCESYVHLYQVHSYRIQFYYSLVHSDPIMGMRQRQLSSTALCQVIIGLTRVMQIIKGVSVHSKYDQEVDILYADALPELSNISRCMDHGVNTPSPALWSSLWSF